MSYLKNKIQKMKEMSRKIDEEDRLDLESSEGTFVEEEKEKFWNQLRNHKHSIRKHRLIKIGIVCVLIIVVLMFLYLHVGHGYWKLSEIERTDTSGTIYTEYANGMLKYSPDGISYYTDNGTVKWSSTFSMQTPIMDMCDTTVVVADCKGTQISIFNEAGQMGQFQTSLPIEKVRVAKQGVVAAVLSDGNVTWINFYDAQGKEIAKNRTSIGESGYPLDIALSPDGLKMMVSYLNVTKGKVNTTISYYNFDSVGQAEINNMVASQEYEDNMIPEVFFANADTSIALQTDGFSIFKGTEVPEQKKEIKFEEEILSVFHDKEHIGFVFNSDNEKHKYKVQIYNISGKQLVKTYIDINYKQIKLVEGNLIIYNDKTFEIYTTSGKKRYSGDFEKPIENIIDIGGFRKYMVLTGDQEYSIRLK